MSQRIQLEMFPVSTVSKCPPNRTYNNVRRPLNRLNNGIADNGDNARPC
jgi:hypothetical protein